MGIIDIKNNVEKILDDNKAQNITCIDLKNKSYIADYMVIASGTSSRHLQALSEILVSQLKKLGIDNCRIEGKDSNDWKLVDAHDVIVHIFHPEKREFYDLEKMWSEEIPKEKAMIWKKFLFYQFLFLAFSRVVYSKNDLYEKIDLFGEVLENIQKDYVDEVDQVQMMDSAINGVLQSLDPYSAYMSPELLKKCRLIQKVSLEG